MKKIVLSGVEETLYYEKLKSGMEVYMYPTTSSSFNISLNVKFGSSVTDFKDNNKKRNFHLPNGTAHFLEHLMFKMEDGTDATEYFYKLGSDANAFTTFNLTAYTISATSLFKENLSHLLEYVFTPYFTEKNVKEEKGIIISETNMTDDDIGSKMINACNANLFSKNNIRNKICGEVSDIKKISLKDIEMAYNYFYNPDNMFLVITGNFNPEEALGIIEEKQKNWKLKDVSVTIKKYREPAKVLKNEVIIPGNSKKMMFAFKVPILNNNINERLMYCYADILFACNFGRTSEFQNRLITGNIINMPLSMQVYYTDNYFIVYIIADTDYPERLITLMKEQASNMSITESDLKRKVKVLKSEFILTTDDPSLIDSYIQTEIIKYSKFNNELFELFDLLNYKDASLIIKNLNLKNMVTVRFENKCH